MGACRDQPRSPRSPRNSPLSAGPETANLPQARRRQNNLPRLRAEISGQRWLPNNDRGRSRIAARLREPGGGRGATYIAGIGSAVHDGELLMASIRLGRYEVEEEGLPAVCMRC